MSKGLYQDQDEHSVHLILGQTVCKGYQQTTKVTACRERIKMIIDVLSIFRPGAETETSHG